MTAFTPPVDRAEILRALPLLHEPGSVVEVRIPDCGRDGTVSGYFNDFGALADVAVHYSGKVPAVYVTLNEINPALLARCANRVQTRAKLTTGDADVIRRRWLPLDLDPVRPSGVSSTDAEHQAAIDRMREILAWLRGEMGFPAFILASSGNGAHGLGRIDMPNDDRHRDLIKRALQALAARFDTDTLKLDQSVFNAARIWKLYGTCAGKGDQVGGRRHRLAGLGEVPQ